MKAKSKTKARTLNPQPAPRANGTISFADDPSALLTYSLGTDPSPLTVSLPGGNPVLAALSFVITNQQSKPVEVASIAFTIQLGADGAALAVSSNDIKTAPSDTTIWKVTASSSTDAAVYTLGPQTGSAVTLQPGDSVVLQIYNIAVNNAVGVTTVGIKEMVVGNDPAFPEFNVTKFPYGFYFDGLVATVKSGSAQVPVAQVGYNGSVRLLWNSSVTEVTAFQVFYATNQGQQATPPVTTPGQWDSPALTRDSVFTVVVTSTTIGGQTVSASMSISVAVQQPDVVANSLQVAGPATVQATSALQGAVTVGTASANANLAVNGGVNVTGAATLATASISGPLAAAGTVAMMTGARSVGTGLFTATTDGFVLGYVSPPGGIWQNSLCWTQVRAAYGSVIASAIGGNFAILDSAGNAHPYPNYGSFLLPVPAGQSVFLSVSNYPNNAVSGQTALYWIPVGMPTGPTLRRVSRATRPARFVPAKKNAKQRSIKSPRSQKSGRKKNAKRVKRAPSAVQSKQRKPAPRGRTSKTKRATRSR